MDRQYKPRNYLKNVTFIVSYHVISLNRQYKPRNYLKNVTFILLNMSRGNWKWFRLETILNNIDMKKASWVNYVISLNRQYKPRNYLKNVTFNLLIISKGNWKWFRLVTILNNIEIKKASWVNYVISLNRQYKPRNYIKNVTFNLLNS